MTQKQTFRVENNTSPIGRDGFLVLGGINAASLEVLELFRFAGVRLPLAESTSLAQDLASLVLASALVGAQLGVLALRGFADVDQEIVRHDGRISVHELGLREGIHAVVAACTIIADEFAEGGAVTSFSAGLGARAAAVDALLRSISFTVAAVLICKAALGVRAPRLLRSGVHTPVTCTAASRVRAATHLADQEAASAVVDALVHVNGIAESLLGLSGTGNTDFVGIPVDVVFLQVLSVAPVVDVHHGEQCFVVSVEGAAPGSSAIASAHNLVDKFAVTGADCSFARLPVLTARD